MWTTRLQTADTLYVGREHRPFRPVVEKYHVLCVE